MHPCMQVPRTEQTSQNVIRPAVHTTNHHQKSDNRNKSTTNKIEKGLYNKWREQQATSDAMTASNKNNIAEPEPGAKTKAKKGKFRGPVAHNPQRKNPEKQNPATWGEKLREKPNEKTGSNKNGYK